MIKNFLLLCCFLFCISFLSVSAQQTQEQASLTPVRLGEAKLLQQLQIELKQRCSQDLFSGVVLIAKNDKPIFQHVCGMANREKKIPNTLETQFNLGSMNKMFTSIAIAQLVSQGRLRYLDTLAQILPDYPNQEAAQKITVEQLVTHASGLGDLFTDEFMQDRLKIDSLNDYLPYFANQPLQFDPGTKRSYSNAGFVVAGLIIRESKRSKLL